MRCLSSIEGNAKARLWDKQVSFSHVFFMSIPQVLTFNAKIGRIYRQKNKDMLKVEWCKQLSNGEFITNTEILSPFLIFKDSRKFNRFLLIPKQKNLSNMLIIANNIGIRLCKKSLFHNVQKLINNNCTTLTEPHIPMNSKNIICDKLWEIFEYKKTDTTWTIKFK